MQSRRVDGLADEDEFLSAVSDGFFPLVEDSVTTVIVGRPLVTGVETSTNGRRIRGE